MKTLRTVGLLVTVLSIAACAKDATCGPGEEFRDGACFTVTPQPDAGAEDASMGDGSAADAGPATCKGDGTDLAAVIGATCTTVADCACPSDFCAVQPGDATGFCTQRDCLDGTVQCPGGAGNCFDLSFAASVDPMYEGLSVCLAP